MAQHCFFCGHLVGDDGCERCGTERHVRDERRVRAPCPRCGKDARLVPLGLGEATLQACPRCKGMFAGAIDWDTLLDVFAQEPLPDMVVPDVDESTAYGPYRSAPSSRAAQIDLAPPVRCPTCEDEMERLVFAALSDVVIDVCPAHGVWLDAGELERVIESASPQPLGEPVLHVVSEPTSPRHAPPVDAEVEPSPVTARTETFVPPVEPSSDRVTPVAPIPRVDDRWTARLGRSLRRLIDMIASKRASP